MPSRRLDNLATQIAVMERPQLIESLRSLNCPFSLDFSDEYLTSISVDRLRHILMAAALHSVRAESAGGGAAPASAPSPA